MLAILAPDEALPPFLKALYACTPSPRLCHVALSDSPQRPSLSPRRLAAFTHLISSDTPLRSPFAHPIGTMFRSRISMSPRPVP